MKKIAYLTPATTVVSMELKQLIAYSGGSQQDKVGVDDNPDETPGPNRSRRRRDVWDDYEEE